MKSGKTVIKSILALTIGSTIAGCSVNPVSPRKQIPEEEIKKESTQKPNPPLKSWLSKRQAIPPIIIGMVSAATRLAI